MRRRLARTMVAALLIGLVGTRAAAAQTTGTIEGEVRDIAGGALASADILVSSVGLQGSRTARTDREGKFRLPGLPPGAYTVTATLAGFHPEARSITVSLGGRTAAAFSLQPAVEEAVSVLGEAPRIDMTSTTGGTAYTARVIESLPVDRNYADIVRSNPGVATDQGESQGRSLGLTVYGATSAENQWIIDGVNTTNIAKGIQGKAINNEFVQEVEVKTGGYSAEYGGALGGVVNVVTKSGGNEFHGGAFVYYDSGDTAAQQVFNEQEDFVAAAMRWADYQKVDYGVDLGSYLLKDRLWFFGAYNRVTLDGHVSRVVPVDLVSTSDRFPIDSADNLYSGKLTWNVAPSTSVVAAVFADPTSSSGATGVDPRQDQRLGRLEDTAIQNPDKSTWYSARQLGGTDFAIRATQLFGPRGLVTLQVGRHQDSNSLTAADQIRTIDLRCPPDEPPGTPTSPCDPPTVPNSVKGGFGIIDGPLDHSVSFRNQARVDATYYAGAHELKAGGSYGYGGGDSTFSVTGGQEVEIRNDYGQLYYAHDFPVRSLQDLTPVTGVKIRAKAQNIGAYIQDSWTPAAGLTVNIGLRWEQQHLLDYQGTLALRLDNEWQPRLGITWDPWRDGRTKLYAFAGRFYYALPTLGTGWAFHNFAAVYTYNFDPNSVVPDMTVIGHEGGKECWAGCGATGDGKDVFDAVDRGVRGTYQDELSVGAERMLDSTLTVGVKGTYRRLGNAVEDRCDFYLPPADVQATTCSIINPGSGETYAKGDAPVCNGFSGTQYWQCTATGPATPPARRLYRAIEVLARKSIGSTLWLQASYIYSSLRGNYDGAVNETFQGSIPGLSADFDWPGFWHNAYGRLYLDRPNRFRFDGYWVTPWRIAVGLQAFAASGPPEDRIGFYPNVYVIPRGSAGRMPAQWDANLTLSYPIVFGPATVTLQAYLFDMFNNQIPTNQYSVWTNGQSATYPDYDPTIPADNDDYGKYSSRQSPRSFRAAVRVSF